MDPATETPQYRLLEPAFYAPELIPAGSIISTEAPPGPHLEPWNEAAVLRMAAWLTIEVDEIDPLTKKKTGNRIRPNEKYRRVTYTGGAQQTATVIAPPVPADANGTSLAEINIRAATDPRPPVARKFSTRSPVENSITSAAPGVIIDPPVVAVIEKGPKATTVTGGPT